MALSDKLIEEIAPRLREIQAAAHLEMYKDIMAGTVFVVDGRAYLITTGRVLYVAKSGQHFECIGAGNTGIPNDCPRAVLDFFFGEQRGSTGGSERKGET